MIESREVFTRDEIHQIFGEIVTVVAPDEVDVDVDVDRHLLFRCGAVSFLGLLSSGGPFHSHIILIALNWIETNPFEFVNDFNTKAYAARAYVEINEDGTLLLDDDGRIEI